MYRFSSAWLAILAGSNLVPVIEVIIDDAYRGITSPATLSAESFLAAAREMLPEGLYAQVCLAIETEESSRGVIGTIRSASLRLDELPILK
ncbi:MAG: hypothetical protein JRN15_19265 [Nitrososphaerota archaeon]|nr:hypothetical protein [Nitrososphaerota archaeon]